MEGEMYCQLLRNSICHAFNALEYNANGCAPKSRLQVLAASLGNLLKVQNVEKGLPDYRSTPFLRCNEFLFYLQRELFAALPENLTAEQFKEIKRNVDDFCWVIYKQMLVLSENDTYPDDYYFKLFRIFCVLSDFYEVNVPNCVKLNMTEVKFITELLDKTLGKDIDTSSIPVSVDGEGLSFKSFLSFVEISYKMNYEKEAVLEAVNEVYDIVVENVIKKGYLKKSLSLVGPWWEMWCILKQHSFSWSLNRYRKDQWGELNLYNTEVEVKNGKGSQFSLSFGSKSIVLYAVDCATKFQWIAALNTAIKHSKNLDPMQRHAAIKRRQTKLENPVELEETPIDLTAAALNDQNKAKQWIDEVLEDETERLRNLQGRMIHSQLEDPQTRNNICDSLSKISPEPNEETNILDQKEAELNEERQRREQLEVWQKERQAEIDKLTSVIASLEQEKEQLNGTLQEKLHLEEVLQIEKERLKNYEQREKLLLEQLKEERQAKEDEEIVRNLQSRMLNEEWEKIEAMEKELQAERQRREELEAMHKERQAESKHLASVASNFETDEAKRFGTLKKIEVLLAEQRNKTAAMIPQQNLKRSLSADFSFIKSGNLSVPLHFSENENNC